MGLDRLYDEFRFNIKGARLNRLNRKWRMHCPDEVPAGVEQTPCYGCRTKEGYLFEKVNGNETLCKKCYVNLYEFGRVG